MKKYIGWTLIVLSLVLMGYGLHRWSIIAQEMGEITPAVEVRDKKVRTEYGWTTDYVNDCTDGIRHWKPGFQGRCWMDRSNPTDGWNHIEYDFVISDGKGKK